MSKVGTGYRDTLQDRAEAGVIKGSVLEETSQPWIRPKWRRDVIGPAVLSAAVGFVSALAIMILIIPDRLANLLVAIFVSGVMFTIVFYWQMAFYDLAHYIKRRYKEPEILLEDNRPVFVAENNGRTQNHWPKS